VNTLGSKQTDGFRSVVLIRISLGWKKSLWMLVTLLGISASHMISRCWIFYFVRVPQPHPIKIFRQTLGLLSRMCHCPKPQAVFCGCITSYLTLTTAPFTSLSMSDLSTTQHKSLPVFSGRGSQKIWSTQRFSYQLGTGLNPSRGLVLDFP
jgi:hypothetical protein